MHQLIEFIQNHWLLWIALVAILIAIIVEEGRTKLRQTKGLSAQKATMLLNHEEAIVVDVRSVDAFQKEHIIAAINSPPPYNFEEISKKLQEHKEKTIILVDNLGNTTPQLANKLTAQGFAKVSFLTGGITAWKNAKLPLTNR